LRQPLSYEACHDVGGTTGGKSHNDAHRPRRIDLCANNARHDRQRGSTRGQMQKPSAGKFHLINFRLASLHSITSSARASNVGGISRPSVSAVLRLMISSYLVGA